MLSSTEARCTLPPSRGGPHVRYAQLRSTATTSPRPTAWTLHTTPMHRSRAASRHPHPHPHPASNPGPAPQPAPQTRTPTQPPTPTPPPPSPGKRPAHLRLERRRPADHLARRRPSRGAPPSAATEATASGHSVNATVLRHRARLSVRDAPRRGRGGVGGLSLPLEPTTLNGQQYTLSEPLLFTITAGARGAAATRRPPRPRGLTAPRSSPQRTAQSARRSVQVWRARRAGDL